MPTPVPLADLFAPADWLAFLNVSLTGIQLLRPVYAPDGRAIVDFTLEYTNPTGLRMVGFSEPPSGTLLQHFPATLAAGVFAYYQRAFATSEPLTYEANYQADGVDNYFRFSAQRSGGRLLVNFTDTSDQPRTPVEEALRNSQAREQAARAEVERQRGELQRVFEQAPVAIAVYRGPAYAIELANPTVCRLWGRTPAQLLGRGLFEALPEVAGMGFEELLDGVMATGVPHVAHEMPAVHERDGRRDTVYWNFVYLAMRAEDGHVSGAMVVATEVTEQVLARQQVQQVNEEMANANEALMGSNLEYLRANAALSEAQQQLRHLTQELEARVHQRTRQLGQQTSRLERLLQEAPAAICMLDGPDLVFEFVNPGYQQLFPGRVLRGQPVLAALPEIAGGPVEAMLRGVYGTGVTFEGQEVLMSFARPGDGMVEDRYFNFTYQARYGEDGQIDGLVVFAFEVTEQVQARRTVAASAQQAQALAANLAEANQQLTRVNVDLDTFVYAASHDLKAPIANIEGLLNVLREYLPPETQEPMVPRLVGMMEGAIARFQQTVGHLTDVSRLHHARPVQAAGTLDVPQVLADVRLDLLPLLESSRADLVVAVEACPGVRFSAPNLRSVLFNLLSNAVKYRAPDRVPQVHVRTHCADQQLVLEVQDNGLGLSAQQQGDLFTMFRRLHTHVEGSGVGLYLIKRTIENAGGTITVQSQPDAGSTFTVTLPRA